MTNDYDHNSPQSAINVLRRFVRPRAPEAAERCDLCGAGLAEEHSHLFEPPTRQLFCSCEACAILFGGQTETKYRRVPRRVRRLADFRLSDAQWESLLLPIGMAFFFHSSPAGRTLALYPSPAGATESLLDLSAWAGVLEENPVLRELEPDVEALLVNRVRGANDYYLAPIDECFKLVGLIRAGWRGLSGGAEVWKAIEEFFAELKQKSGAVQGAARA
ncbi:MAG: hypothetical protein JOZ02_11255 [Acidobacteria bacterium]|nr:hypothetical protein [Acidobacteriota bacterium]